MHGAAAVADAAGDVFDLMHTDFGLCAAAAMLVPPIRGVTKLLLQMPLFSAADDDDMIAGAPLPH